MLRALLCLTVVLLPAASQALTLTKDGKSDYAIVLAANASPSEKHAANELQSFLREISGAELPIVGDDQPLKPHEIILGLTNAHVGQLDVKPDLPDFGNEGFAILTVGERLLIVGAPQRGTMYGVYTFLEDHLGCRWFSSKVSRIPKQPTIEFGEINDTQVPVLEYREPFYYDAFDADWAARNKANSQSARLDEEHGGKVTYYPFVHTFYNLIPPDQYFDQHPEYFSEINGKRVRDGAQLCLTNPDVVRLTIAKVREWIDSHPGVNIISVSQNDCGGYCECPNCKALAEAEGSQSGPIVAFVNQVAEAIEKDYPNVAIDTLAYSYSRKPPKTIRPRPNVIIRLCSIECCFSHPLATCDYPQNVSFRDDIVGWSKRCDRLYIWDYVTSFANYLTPFPNWDVLQPNIKFFVQNGVKGIFEEGNYNSPGGEMAELRAYIMAKCLWNPDYDANKAMAEFLEGYYGPTAPAIHQHIDLLTAKVRDENLHMHIWEGPWAAFLTPDVLTHANELFDEAENLAKGDPETLQRVETARVPLLYVATTQWQAPPEDQWTIRDGRWAPPPDPVFGAQVDRFFAIADREGITCHHEGSNTIPALREAMLEKRDGFPALELAGDRTEAAVVPAKGARVVRLRRTGGVELAAAGAAYRLSLSRSPEGPGAVEAFTPTEAPPVPGRSELAAELKDGLRLTRRLEVTEGPLSLWSTIENTGDQSRDLLAHASVNLNLGPADAVVMTGPAGPISLAIPEDQTTRTLMVPAEVVASGQIALANGETLDAVTVGFRPGAVDWAVVTASTGRVPLRVDLYRQVRALAPGQTQALVHWLDPLHLAEVIGAEKPREHHAEVIEVQDDQFSLYKEGELSEFAMDATASDGWAARQLGSDKEWSIQWPIDVALFEPGVKYKLSAVARIDKKGDAGAALSFGVYDSANRVGVLNGGRSVADMPEGWQTIEIGSFVPAKGMYVWTAPPTNGDNVAWVYVDKLIFEKVKE